MCGKTRTYGIRFRGELVVSTPASGQVSTNSVCVGCLIDMLDHRFKVNLIYLLLEGLDVILGMD